MKKDDQISFASTRVAMQKFKIVMVGDQNVGKSSVIIRYVKNNFKQTNNPTIGIDFTSKNVLVNGKTVRLQLWDTAGQERFRSLIPSYLKDCNLAIVVFDVTNSSACQSLQKWIDFVREARGQQAQICIAGNKIDLQSEIQKEVIQQAKKIAKQQEIPYYQVSALSGTNINQMFQQFAESLSKSGPSNQIKTESKQTQSIKQIPQQQIKKQSNQSISLTTNVVTPQANQTGTCC